MTSKRPLDDDGSADKAAKRTQASLGTQLNYQWKPLETYITPACYNYAVHEALPKMPSSLPEYAKAERLVSEAIDIVANELETVDARGQEIDTLLAEIQKHKIITPQESIKVGLVGDAGHGKSSFLGALLGHPGLTKQGDSGASCTQVVTEFAHVAGQPSAFIATVEFKDVSLINQEIAINFQRYMASARSQNDDIGDTNADEDDDDDEDDMQSDFEVATAEEYLLQVFANLPEYSDAETLRQTAVNLPCEKDEHTIQHLQDACRSALYNEGMCQGSRQLLLVCESADQVCEKVEKYSSVAESGDIGWWPLVDIVRISFDSPLLAHGFTIADCPGVSDVNLARREATQKYIQNCSVVIIMAQIDRICTSNTVRTYIKTYINKKGAQNVILLPTKVDSINQDPTMLDPIQKALLSSLKKEEKRSLNSLIKLKRANPSYQDAAYEYSIAKRSLQRNRILIRNANVVLALERIFFDQDIPSSAQLTVIPISSAVHSVYVDGKAFIEPLPVLYPGEDNLYLVRSDLCIRSEDWKLQALNQHTYHVAYLPLSRLSLTLDNMTAADDLSLDSLHLDAVSESTTLQDDVNEQLTIYYTKHVKDTLATYQATIWENKTKHLLDGFQQSTHFRTLAAFARHNGYHRPKRQPALVDWNQELIMQALPDIRKSLTEFETKLKTLTHLIKVHIHGLFTRVEDELKNIKMLKSIFHKFWENFKEHRRWFDYNLPMKFDCFIEKLRKGLEKVATVDRSSCFNQAMRGIYKAMYTAEFPKHKRTKHRWDFLRREIKDASSIGPFSELQAAFHAIFKLVCFDFQEELRTFVETPFQNINKDLAVLFAKAKSIPDQATRAKLEVILSNTLPIARAKFAQAQQCVRDIETWKTNREAEMKVHFDEKLRRSQGLEPNRGRYQKPFVEDVEDEDMTNCFDPVGSVEAVFLDVDLMDSSMPAQNSD